MPDGEHTSGAPPTGPGKRSRRPLGISTVGSNHNKTMIIWDYASNRSFLVDTGADESVFPAVAQDKTLPRTQSLVAANGTEIPTFCQRELSLSLAPGHSVAQHFWIANVKRPILGWIFSQPTTSSWTSPSTASWTPPRPVPFKAALPRNR